MSIGEVNADELQGLVGRTLGDRYRLEKFIDRGGFGAVYRAMDIRFERVVAVKVGTSLRELKKEAVLAGQVQHDHVVQVTDYGNEGGLAFMVMEFLNGQNLEALLGAYERNLPGYLIRKFVQEVGDALIHAHAESLIHRDLKPRNVILKRSTARGASASAVGKFVLLDFGIAAKLDATGTMANRTMTGAGTVEYMAPELLGRVPQATTQTDIYAFGIMLYQLLTGGVPFPQEDSSHLALAECLRAISSAPPPPFQARAPDRSYPPAIEELVRQCLEKDPAKRPASMEEVCQRFLADFPSDSPDGKAILKGDTGVLGGASTTPTPVPQTGWRTYLVATVIAVSGVAGFLLTRPPLKTPTASLRVDVGTDQWEKLPDGPLEIIAGGKKRLLWKISDAPEADVNFEVTPTVDGLELQRSSGTGDQSCILTLDIPDPNTLADEHSLTLRATIPSQAAPLELPLTLKVSKPQPWLPKPLADNEGGFRIPDRARLHKVGERFFATPLERTIGNPARRSVTFSLVVVSPELSKQFPDDLRGMSSFYVMERPVSNAEFDEFALKQPDFEDKPPKELDVDRKEDERGWKVRNDFPVTDISALEAQRFADWLAPGRGALPSLTEWDVASGYYDFRLAVRTDQDLAASDMAARNEPELRADSAKLSRMAPKRLSVMGVEVWLGKSPRDSEYDGESGRSLYGLRYLTRPTDRPLYEFTSDVTSESDSLKKKYSLHEITKPSDLRAPRVWCRGPASSETHFSFVTTTPAGAILKNVEELNRDGSSLPLLWESKIQESPRREEIGFRVVVRTHDN